MPRTNRWNKRAARVAWRYFGEKYGDLVRTVVIETDGERYSYELCGGVHVRRTAEIGSFVFTSEGSVSAGIRRVEALTGIAAHNYLQGKVSLVDEIAAQLGTTPDSAANRLSGLQTELAGARREIDIPASKTGQVKLRRDA